MKLHIENVYSTVKHGMHLLYHNPDYKTTAEHSQKSSHIDNCFPIIQRSDLRHCYFSIYSDSNSITIKLSKFDGRMAKGSFTNNRFRDK